MKKWTALLLAAAMLFALTACGEGHSSQEVLPEAEREPLAVSDEDTVSPLLPKEEIPAEGEADAENTVLVLETAAADSEEPAEPHSVIPPEESAPDKSQHSTSQPEPAAIPETDKPRILIAYFTWADNTVVEDRDAAVQSALNHYESIGDASRYEGVDATTSASVVAPGNAARIAGWIQQEVGGDLFSIVAADAYPCDYDACMDRAAEEKAANARPELTGHVSGMENYDIVFIGFPNWWYTVPMAVLSFVEEYDFSGKTIVPFCTHGTGGLSATVRDLTAALPDDAAVLDPIGVYRAEINSAQPAVQAWLAGLNLAIESN